MHGKIYLSDEGYGHIVRQRAVMEALRERQPLLDFTVQTHRHMEAVKRIIPGISYTDRYNNITWHKHPNGSPDLNRIAASFEDYLVRSEAYIKRELDQEASPDFVISDFVYEAFSVAKARGIPSFGVAHFTWDWFFSKLYPPVVPGEVMKRFFAQAKSADVLYFPPFTPEEILHYYRDNAIEVPLIVRTEFSHKAPERNGKFRVLIMDSGAGVLRGSILKALNSVEELDDIQFFVSSTLQCANTNVCYLPEGELMVDYVRDMDLVIGRAGFNTISECIGLRTPMLLIGEAMNPEMNENILNLKKVGLGSFISLDTFEEDLHRFLPHFIAQEYQSIKDNMASHEMPLNGAAVIADDLLSRLP